VGQDGENGTISTSLALCTPMPLQAQSMHIPRACKSMSSHLSQYHDQMSYGAIIALAPDKGNSAGACLEESVPMHSVFVGTALSQPSSWDDKSFLFAEYHEPACEASRLAMSTDFVFNLLKNGASIYPNDRVKIAL